MLMFLIKKGVDLNRVDYQGSILMRASYNRRADMVRLLLQNGANKTFTNDRGENFITVGILKTFYKKRDPRIRTIRSNFIDPEWQQELLGILDEVLIEREQKCLNASITFLIILTRRKIYKDMRGLLGKYLMMTKHEYCWK